MSAPKDQMAAHLKAVLDLLESRKLTLEDFFELAVRLTASLALMEAQGDNTWAARYLEEAVVGGIEDMAAQLRARGGKTEPEPLRQ